MALISCQECQGKISAKARACPHCGAPNKAAQMSSCNVLLLILLFAAAAFSIWAIWGGFHYAEEVRAREIRPDSKRLGMPETGR